MNPGHRVNDCSGDFGGWPASNDVRVRYFHRGCPILAFLARVGCDAACAILSVTPTGLHWTYRGVTAHLNEHF
jgi:hypothetical protein